MAGTLLQFVNTEYGLELDADSEGGQVLASLVPDPPLAEGAAQGTAAAGALTLVPSASGVRVAAADPGDALVLALPPVERPFAVRAGPDGTVSVEITLHEPRLRLPGLRPAAPGAEDSLTPAAGDKVEAVLPALLLVVTARPGERFPPARLAPSEEAGALAARIEPPHAFVGPGEAVGLGLPVVTLDLDAPGGMTLGFPQVDVFVAPPGCPALATRGKGRDLVLALAPGGGLSGRTALVAAGDPAHRPRWLHDVAGELWLDRSRPVAVALTGAVALSEEIAAALGGEDMADQPRRIDYRLALALPTPGGWAVTLTLSADGGEGVLWRSARGVPHQTSLARDTLGAYAVFGPLMAPAPAEGGGFVDLALTAAAAAAIATPTPAVTATTQQVTAHGAELSLRSGAGGPEAALMFDLETELSLKVLGDPPLIASRRPIRVRHKAMGLRLGAGEPVPVFDPARGFDLDLSDPGMFEVREPLRDFLQPDNPSVARDNPFVLALDLAPKLDLGIVKLDRATIRVPLNGGALPSLSALGARIEAGLFSGSGRFELRPDGFGGGVRASFGQPVGISAGGGLSVERKDGIVSVRVSFEVGWPLPIPLGNSGLGFYGILGLFAARSRRDQGDGTALAWFDAAWPDLAGGAWQADPDGWAVALGAVLGTLEGGTALNTKGLVMIELPGPRLVLVMRAQVLTPKPALKATGDAGTGILAVMEISDKALTIGIVARHEIPFLLEIVAPADARFDFEDPRRWSLDLGRFDGQRVSVRFMRSIRADGYLMLHGDDLPATPVGRLPGPATITGIRAALTWGPQEIGLFMRVAAQADVGLSFDPVLLIGGMALEGELHLFVASLGVKAEAQFRITAEDYWVSARVEGRIRLFFVTIRGEVRFELGNKALAEPAPPPAARALSLQARTPPLLPGTGAAAVIDGTLGQAAQAEGDPGPEVPIDAIPVIEFALPPAVGPGVTLDGAPLATRPGQWVQRGQRLTRYTLTGLEVAAEGHDTPFGAGEATPSAWYERGGAAALSLLNAIPEATPSAAIRSIERDAEVTRRWGGVCRQVAPPAAILWTFAGAWPGPSADGWDLAGTPWPDPPDSQRFLPPGTRLTVTEPWRTGDPLAEALVAVQPAGIEVPAPGVRLLRAPLTGKALEPRPLPEGMAQAIAAQVALPVLDTLPDALRLSFEGLRRLRALILVHGENWLFLCRAFDGTGAVLAENVLARSADARAVASPADLPPEWTDPAGPWHAQLDPLTGPGRLYLLEADLPEGTDHIDLGRLELGMPDPPPWRLAAVEALTEAEWRRARLDEEHRQERIRVVNGAFAAEDASRRLLRPGTAYRVTVNATVETAQADPQGNPLAATPPRALPPQVFRFRTAVKAPALPSYVLATVPSDGERDVFTDDPVRVVFAHGGVRKLFAAHGASLFAEIRAASGRHPQPMMDGVAGLAGRIDLMGIASQPMRAMVETPFMSALEEATRGLDCVVGGDRLPQDGLVLPITLAPRMNHVLDIVLRGPEGAIEADPLYPPVRRSFSTSRYASAPAFAEEIGAAAALAGHRHAADATALAALGGPVVADLEMEAALRVARWGDPAPPPRARATVIWTGAAAPFTPAAVLVETPEPAWRSREIPEEVADALGNKACRLVPRPWLELVEDAPAAASRVLRSGGGMRTLFLLPPGARGRSLHLSLLRTRYPLPDGVSGQERLPAGEVRLSAPPWEGQG